MPIVSNAPSFSCRIWYDRDGLYVELASGLITKFDKTPTALMKVLKLLDREARHYQSPRARATKEKLPMVAKTKRPSKAPTKPDNTTPEQRDRTLDFLTRKGKL